MIGEKRRYQSTPITSAVVLRSAGEGCPSASIRIQVDPTRLQRNPGESIQHALMDYSKRLAREISDQPGLGDFSEATGSNGRQFDSVISGGGTIEIGITARSSDGTIDHKRSNEIATKVVEWAETQRSASTSGRDFRC